MGWFAEQIRERMRRDEEDLADAMEEIGSVITRSMPKHGAVNREEAQEAVALFETHAMFVEDEDFVACKNNVISHNDYTVVAIYAIILDCITPIIN